jgi:preprotein translocase subunit SecB
MKKDETATQNAANQPTNQGLNYRPQGFYLKDLSFESPKAPAIFVNSASLKPSMDLSVDVGVQQLEGPNFEVSLRTTAQARVGTDVIFLVELHYAGVFSINPELEKAEIERILLVDCAKDVFPFARRIIADATREGGFAPLVLDPVDFEMVYQKRKQQAAA